MPASMPTAARPPGRVLVQLAGALSQLACGVCLLIGTIALVLVQQTKAGSLGAVGGWLAAAMVGLVVGGLVYRGGLFRLLFVAAIDAGFGISLIALDYATLRALLKILPASDVTLIGDGLNIAGITMISIGGLCLLALPQGVRFARWFRDAAATRTAMSTARGFPPPPVSAYSSAYILPADVDPSSRRRLYIMLGGVAIGVGAGIGVLVSSSKPPGPEPVARVIRADGGSAAASGVGAAAGRVATSGVGSAVGSAGSAGPTRPAIEPAVAPPVAPPVDAGVPAIATSDPARPPGELAHETATVGAVKLTSAQQLVTAQREAIGKVDLKALADLLIPGAFAFGVDADEVAEGRALIAAQLARDIGEAPTGGFTVSAKAQSIGGERGHAWIALNLELAAPGQPTRRLAISELAASIDGGWHVIAMHWAMPVSDATAERRAILNTLPRSQPLGDRHDGSDELDRAVRAAFASRAGFAEAQSERTDAFNFGSGGERGRGGVAIKRIFSKLRAQIRIRDGVRVVAGGAWDPAQATAPWIGWAAMNVDYTARSRAATEFTQTFRVLAIMIKEGAAWRIVQTQWSNGGPIHDD